MHFLVEQFGWIPSGLLATLFIFFRYSLLAGVAYGIFYLWGKSRYAAHKIQQRYPKPAAIWHELQHAMISAGIFASVGLSIYGLRLMGWSQVYTEISTYGWSYLFFSFLVLIIVHDTYFYWLHRLMHHPRFFRWFHLTHHKSSNPTPWASLAFHPLEAFAEIAIIPVLVLLIPLHPLALVAFASWSLVWNIVGHLGFELFPAGWVDHWLLRWFNTSTHHNLHHRYSTGNYGLYFNWWDYWMGTNHPDYKTTFRELTRQKTTSVAP